MALGLGGVAGLVAVGGLILAFFGVLRAERAADFTFLVFFAAYSVGVFVSLWNETPSEERPHP
jgi:hypothetical protein